MDCTKCDYAISREPNRQDLRCFYCLETALAAAREEREENAEKLKSLAAEWEKGNKCLIGLLVETKKSQNRAEKAERERDEARGKLSVAQFAVLQGPQCPSPNHSCEHNPPEPRHCTECHAKWWERVSNPTPTGSGEGP